MQTLLDHKFHLLCLAVIGLEVAGLVAGLNTLAQSQPLLLVPVVALLIPGLLVLVIITTNIVNDWGCA